MGLSLGGGATAAKAEGCADLSRSRGEVTGLTGGDKGVFGSVGEGGCSVKCRASGGCNH